MVLDDLVTLADDLVKAVRGTLSAPFHSVDRVVT
jgi:hypothetical protein